MMRYRDLPSTTGKGRKLPNGATVMQRQPQMRSAECGDGPFSAERGDYFWADPDAEVTCGTCGGVMELGHEVTRWEAQS